MEVAEGDHGVAVALTAGEAVEIGVGLACVAMITAVAPRVAVAEGDTRVGGGIDGGALGSVAVADGRAVAEGRGVAVGGTGVALGRGCVALGSGVKGSTCATCEVGRGAAVAEGAEGLPVGTAVAEGDGDAPCGEGTLSAS